MRKGIGLIVCLMIIAPLISCGGGTSSSSAPPGVNTGIPSVVQLLPLQYVAQTNAYLYLKAKVLDGNGTPLKDVTVYFTNLSQNGTLDPLSAKTDGNGYATTRLQSTVSGFITILAEVNSGSGKIRDKKTVYFTSSDTNIYLLPYMTLDVDSVPGNGIYNEASDFYLFEETYDDTVEVLATVYDRWGQPVAGTPIEWGTDQAEAVQLEPINSMTNTNGQAKAIIRDIPLSLRDTVTFLNVTASAPYVDGIGAANMVSLFLNPVSIDTSLSYLTADPSVVNKEESSTITAVVYMNTGEPIYDGATINFTTSPKTNSDPKPCGSITPFAQTTGGVATAEFIAPPTPGTCTITAKLRGTIIGTVDVMVITPLEVIPSTLTIDGVAGGTATFTIYGGIPPYQIITDNPNFPPVPSTVQKSGDSFTVTVPANTLATTVTYTIRDMAGSTVTAKLEIKGAEVGELMVLPDKVSVIGIPNPDTDTSDDVVFTIYGGTAPYTVISDHQTIIPNQAVTGNTFTVDPDDVNTATDVKLTVVDSSNNTAEVTVTVNPTDFYIMPTNVTISVGDSLTFTIFGGTPPFQLFVDVPSAVQITYTGGTSFTAKGLSAATVKITVLDINNGRQTTATLTIQ
ncbi:MAG: hypothetical protein Fur0020_05040 [Thermodesulfovibrionia bacterium]